MLQFPSNPSRAPSHYALVDSCASIHILTCHTFLSDASVNHSAVASFAGSTSRATHKGTFGALVQCTNNKFHHLVQKNSALVVPDASRMLFSISQALLAGHHVHFRNSPGLLLKDTKAFIPFVRDTHTGMYLLPLVPPVSRHNGTYPLQQAMRAAVPLLDRRAPLRRRDVGRARRGLEGGSKVNPGSPLGQPWVPNFWRTSVGPRRKLDNGGSR
jgi:hypothetical protein